MDLLSLSKGASREVGTGSAHLISSTCTYYHYLCDGVDDRVRVQYLNFVNLFIYLYFVSSFLLVWFSFVLVSVVVFLFCLIGFIVSCFISGGACFSVSLRIMHCPPRPLQRVVMIILFLVYCAIDI